MNLKQPCHCQLFGAIGNQLNGEFLRKCQRLPVEDMGYIIHISYDRKYKIGKKFDISEHKKTHLFMWKY